MNFKFGIKFYLAVMVLCLCNLIVYKNILITPSISHTLSKEFPSQISDWKAEAVVYDKDVLSVLSPDKIIYKKYKRQGSPSITLFMACYNTLEKADLSHSPIVCFTGQGWEISDSSKKEIPVHLSKNQKIKVNQLIQKKAAATMFTLFWYQSANQAFSNRGFQKISLFFDKLFGKPEYNAFVRVTVNVPIDRSLGEITSELYGFIQDFYPELKRFFL